MRTDYETRYYESLARCAGYRQQIRRLLQELAQAKTAHADKSKWIPVRPVMIEDCAGE